MPQTELRVGFIGMGIMGAPMAANCLKAGFPVTVWNRTAAKSAPLREQGATVAESPAHLADGCDVVISCVTASQDVLQVLLDPEKGVLAGIGPGATVIDHSTVAPAVAQTCAQAFARKNVGFLDAPISGGDVGARNGTLSIMVGGDRTHFDRVRPVLNAMGQTITYCGAGGAGYVVKLCNQVLVSMNLLAVCEAVSLAEGAGVDVDAMLAAVSGGAAGSWQLSNLGPKVRAADYAPGFFVDYLLKDLGMAQQAARDAATPLPGLALAHSLLLATAAQGHGRDGTQALYETMKALRGA